MATLRYPDKLSDLTQKFKSLIEGLPDTAEPPDDLFDLYKHYGLEQENSGWSSAHVEEHLAKRVERAFKSEVKDDETLRLIFRELFLRENSLMKIIGMHVNI
ncbi:MAG: hypothetical protein HC933_08505 [Pleurocapsa sp. SU_196_0]|nr:hypothetical protein [Pleurocapsa sp. SU_196_0]